jgi:hypothetical protein
VKNCLCESSRSQTKLINARGIVISRPSNSRRIDFQAAEIGQSANVCWLIGDWLIGDSHLFLQRLRALRDFVVKTYVRIVTHSYQFSQIRQTPFNPNLFSPKIRYMYNTHTSKTTLSFPKVPRCRPSATPSVFSVSSVVNKKEKPRCARVSRPRRFGGPGTGLQLQNRFNYVQPFSTDINQEFNYKPHGESKILPKRWRTANRHQPNFNQCSSKITSASSVSSADKNCFSPSFPTTSRLYSSPIREH